MKSMRESPPPIPQYTLLRSLGRGAYGEVWLARSVTGVYRAVKTVHRASFGEDGPFEREFAGIQRFEAVSVGQESQVALLHVGRNDAAGFFYYVMELADDLVTGEEIAPERYVAKTLKELRADRRRLTAAESIDIGLALTRALAHLHAHGLVHRDVTALAVAGLLWAAGQTRQTRETLERAERAEADAVARLHQANPNWVRANRLTCHPGQRFTSLAELARAAAQTNSLDLRNEAIACLALPDLRPLKRWAKAPDRDTFLFSAQLPPLCDQR
jgi:hypothetical protein